MSRIGKLPIPLPDGVKVTHQGDHVQIQGPKGKGSHTLPVGITCQVDGAELKVSRDTDSKTHRSLHGLTRSLLANIVTGTSQGFTRELQIEGIGYRAQAQGKDLNLTLGYSHPVIYAVPEAIIVAVEGQNKIIVSGTDRQQVGQVAAEIRALRPPEPYKGKGIRYVDEQVKRKVGKTGA